MLGRSLTEIKERPYFIQKKAHLSGAKREAKALETISVVVTFSPALFSTDYSLFLIKTDCSFRLSDGKRHFPDRERILTVRKH